MLLENERIKKSIQFLSTVIAVLGGVSVLAGAYVFYKNSIWHPVVYINDVDYKNGIANLTVSGDDITIYNDSTVAVGGDWGVRFGTIRDPATGLTTYNRIELVRSGLVHYVVFDNSGTANP